MRAPVFPALTHALASLFLTALIPSLIDDFFLDRIAFIISSSIAMYSVVWIMLYLLPWVFLKSLGIKDKINFSSPMSIRNKSLCFFNDLIAPGTDADKP